MTTEEISDIIRSTDRYNLHSHSEFCDGHAPVAEIVAAACRNGFEVWGISPHSPICVDSPCNMSRDDMPTYFAETARLREEYAERMRILTALEVDFISRDFGPHIDYFEKMYQCGELDYRIGSVHFVPNQDGVPLDCDGSYERFARYLRDGYRNDLRYVVEKYFEQVLTMLELGGFELLGHFDKIAGNASCADPTIEDQCWYAALVEDVVRLAEDRDVVVEINTKAIESRKRLYPAERWWPLLLDSGIPLAVNSDCHDPQLTDLGRHQVLTALAALKS